MNASLSFIDKSYVTSETSQLFERKDKPSNKVQLYNWLISFAAAFGGFLFGYESGNINQVFSMYKFNCDFNIYTNCTSCTQCNNCSYSLNHDAANIQGWITFTFVIGCAVGAVLVSYPADIIGRKLTIHLCAFLYVVGSALQTWSGKTDIFYGGRFIAGVGIGSMSASVPLYISEISKTSIRGRLISTYQFMITIGIFIASCVNSLLLKYVDCNRHIQWQLAFGIQIIPSIFLVIVVAFLPFSPRWLIYRGSIATARTILSKLRDLPENDPAFISEFNEIITSIEEERAEGGAKWRDFREFSLMRRAFIGVMLQFFQQWTGINLIIYYGTMLFSKMGFSAIYSSIVLVLATYAISMLATIPGMWLVERVGRRKLLIVGGIVMSISHCMLTIFGLFSDRSVFLQGGAVGSLFLFIIAFASSWGPGVWVYQSEIFPLRSRAKGTSLATFSNWFWNAIISKINPIMFSKLHFYSLLIFGFCCVTMTIFTYKLVPETKGKSLEQIDRSFNRGKKTLLYRRSTKSLHLNQ